MAVLIRTLAILIIPFYSSLSALVVDVQQSLQGYFNGSAIQWASN